MCFHLFLLLSAEPKTITGKKKKHHHHQKGHIHIKCNVVIPQGNVKMTTVLTYCLWWCCVFLGGAASITASSFIQRTDREYGGTRSTGDIQQSSTVLTTVSDSSSSPSPLLHLFNLLIHFKFSTYQMVICSLWTHSIVAFPLVLFNLCINTFQSKKSVLLTPSLTLFTSQHVMAGVLVIPGPVITL